MKRKLTLKGVIGLAFILGGVWLAASNLMPYLNDHKTSAHIAPPSSNVKTEVKAAQKTEPHNLYNVRPKMGEEMGVLSIPKISADLPIFHGTNEDELEKGVGHYAGSVLPGEEDNSVLSGHRDTVFRKLGEVEIGDLLVVNTSAGEFTYKVRKIRIVDADDRTVIVPKPRATLTVTTCYPFNFIGDAPQRYILIGDLVRK
ncbi:class D sortase [Bacillus firmus]|uniref:class D sortase n=1 Tax=Cytobacillus firmus TaxID=1399 RepID=UPI0015801B91|nr:class D sortase [Cytobacillus firmus]MBG9550462.1 sortase [Cytobacillus firmus]MBG9602475.1 sortase [Cytobacillus firmus]MBG9657428.1 sortase [Cytobacillus firmus]MDD9312395.1 class D sortase [Cytobacillus firmus]MED1905248.1 class D sortase [Cytobacillus firmus]